MVGAENSTPMSKMWNFSSESQHVCSGTLGEGVFGSNHLQKLCSSNFCVFESVLVLWNTKTGRRVAVKVSRTVIFVQMLTASLTEALFPYHAYLCAKLEKCTLLKKL